MPFPTLMEASSMKAATRVLAGVPLAVVLFGLVGCSGSQQPAAAPAAGAQAQQDGGQPAEQAGEKKEEPPLTGEVKQKAEQAALAAYPGTVLKSEHDAEKPGMYAVEVQQADGSAVEVYLDTSYKVVDTKKEGTEEEDED
ncbi:PepSY domain-containing protein [Nonomuraea jabiensis]|uniref:PepSY domain-containing protein n=1 Tax=Nonomuraea jabiensis TaxID=882448 RepID=A0A7W9LGZ0_9ACTN|nr:PepSY domain-containing protein [Nonomuraea jabiensis]MBB5783400.1 hypothetical protein [Nonomuraea jabiensis]